jgi:hypothetical protein
MSKKRVGEMSAPTWMLESIRDGEYSKIVYDDTEYVLLKHGHWKQGKNNFVYNIFDCFVCSKCGTAFPCRSPYCGECGAKMDEVEEHSVDAVEVVRCKDCKHNYYNMIPSGEDHECAKWVELPITADFYCAWGEREDGSSDN